jgi:2,3-bisphosphoglycerate-dependent phosphoglycerate mutase
MNTIVCYLLRHAESAPDRRLPEAEWPLSQRGKAQAQALVDILAGLNISHVVSSPYLRARQTVLPFTQQSGLEIAIDHDLRERKLAEGFDADWDSLLRKAWADLSFCAPGGESGLACQQRMAACVNRWIAGAYHNSVSPQSRSSRGLAAAVKALLISSHGNAIGLFLNLFDPAFGYDQWRAMRNPDLFRLFYQDGQLTLDREYSFTP